MSEPARRAEIVIESRKLDLGGTVAHQSLGTIKILLDRNDTRRKSVRQALPHEAAWLLGQLPTKSPRSVICGTRPRIPDGRRGSVPAMCARKCWGSGRRG